jgi:hypothetical protein
MRNTLAVIMAIAVPLLAAPLLAQTPPPGVDGPVHALAVDTNGVYVGGTFSNAAGITASSIAMWDGGMWHALGAGVNGTVRAIAIDGSNVYAGGEFSLAGGTPVNNLAVWNGSAWSDVGGGVQGTAPVVKVIAFDAAGVLVGGVFLQVGTSTAANGLARWTGSAWEVLGGMPPGIEHDLRAMVPLGGTLYVGGVLRFPASPRPSEATLARATPLVLSNHAGSANADDECTGCASVDALTTDGTNLFVAGAFTTLGDAVLSGSPYEVVKLANAITPVGLGTGVAAPTVATGGVIKSLALSGGELYAGGNLGLIRGVAVGHIARWNGTLWASLGAGVDAPVSAITVWNGTVYAGGEFVTAGGVIVNHVARWDGASWTALDPSLTPVEDTSWGQVKSLYR